MAPWPSWKDSSLAEPTEDRIGEEVFIRSQYFSRPDKKENLLSVISANSARENSLFNWGDTYSRFFLLTGASEEVILR